MGASRRPYRELDTEAVVRSRVFVDSRAAAVVEADDVMVPVREGSIDDSHILAEIGEVFAGTHPGRTAPDQITLFKSLGQAVEDVATARLVYQRARARGVGKEVSLE